MSSDAYSWEAVTPPTISVAPLNLEREDQHWRRFDDSMNAVSFGFVATAILVSMFLIMAIFERFLKPTSLPSGGGTTRSDVEAQMVFNPKISCPSPKMTIYANGVSVLMPGEEIPTFIAQAAPMPCPPERTLQPFHQPSRSFIL